MLMRTGMACSSVSMLTSESRARHAKGASTLYLSKVKPMRLVTTHNEACNVRINKAVHAGTSEERHDRQNPRTIPRPSL
jgi:hypothetical protein